MPYTIYSEIPQKLWFELRDIKVELGYNWDRTISYLCEIVKRPGEIKKDYTPYWNDEKKHKLINMRVNKETYKKFRIFCNAFNNSWHALDYLAEFGRKRSIFDR